VSVRAEVAIDGLSVSYTRAGDGPALVLLHGFSFDLRAWRTQIEAFSDQFTVIAWDAPGAGRSSDPPETFGISDWADCLDAFLAAIEVEEAHVLGLSWGGILAQEFYHRHPGRVLSLILADTYAGWKGSLPEPVSQERLEACLRDALLPSKRFLSKYLPGMFGDAVPQEIWEEAANIMSEFHPAGFRLMAKASAVTDTRDVLPTIGVPTLLIWGEDDARSSITVALQLHDAIPGSKLAIIPGAGHVSNMEQPELFNAEVRSFCLGLLDE
jgi:pimeloyl-ACP methyl ester carboxylesterase